MFSTQIVQIADKILFVGPAERVSLPGVLGEFEVGDWHGPMVSILAEGVILIQLADDWMEAQKDDESRSLKTREPRKGDTKVDEKEILTDAAGRRYKSIRIEQGLMRFDGNEMFVVVE